MALEGSRMASQTLAPFWWAVWAATEALLPVGPKTITVAISGAQTVFMVTNY